MANIYDLKNGVDICHHIKTEILGKTWYRNVVVNILILQKAKKEYSYLFANHFEKNNAMKKLQEYVHKSRNKNESKWISCGTNNLKINDHI